MFGFLKKFFGLDKETMKDAGVQIEQTAPYKVPEPPATTPIPLEPPKESVVITVVEKKTRAKRKPAAKMTAGEKKTLIEKKPRTPRVKKS